MSHPDYGAQGWQQIIVSLDGPVAIVKLNRAKQYARQDDTANCRLQAYPSELQAQFDHYSSRA